MTHPKTLVPVLLMVLTGCSSLSETPFHFSVQNSESKIYREHCEQYKDYYQCMEKSLNEPVPRIKVDDMPDDLAELLDIHQDFAEDLIDYIQHLQSACDRKIE